MIDWKYVKKYLKDNHDLTVNNKEVILETLNYNCVLDEIAKQIRFFKDSHEFIKKYEKGKFE